LGNKKYEHSAENTLRYLQRSRAPDCCRPHRLWRHIIFKFIELFFEFQFFIVEFLFKRVNVVKQLIVK
jgi:hypothetical protein